MTTTITAAVLRGGLPLRLETLELPDPRPGEVLVRLAACGICGTDVDLCRSGAPGVILGHEGAGVVEAIGRGVGGVAPGDHVVLSYQSCGACPECRAGHPAGCDRLWELNFGFVRADGSNAYGAVRGHFFGQSSFASHALATERNVVKVDPALPLEMLAPLGCGLQTGAGTVMNTLAVQAGQGVAVFGVGAVGLAAVMAARLAGADPIVAIDRRPRRLALARELGASHAARRLSVAVDHIIDSTGDEGLIRAGLKLLKPHGRLALLTGGGEVELADGRKAFGVIQGDAVPQTFIPRLIALWRAGDFPFDRLIRFYPFAAINRALADAAAGRCVKAVLRM